MRYALNVAAFLLIAASAMLAPTVADAKIRCNGQWQIVNGSEISTPYCGDTYLAKVARGYGSKVTARAVRENPNTKREICDWIGHDPRVQQICAGSRSDFGGSGGRH